MLDEDQNSKALTKIEKSWLISFASLETKEEQAHIHTIKKKAGHWITCSDVYVHVFRANFVNKLIWTTAEKEEEEERKKMEIFYHWTCWFLKNDERVFFSLI